jgi:hypothetical protein
MPMMIIMKIGTASFLHLKGKNKTVHLSEQLAYRPVNS